VAIRTARKAGIPIVIAAKVDRPDREYFEQVIRPLLREPEVYFIGEVDQPGKVALLGQAQVLLFPIAWPEPFGLTMIEAMACGTPVVACDAGSVPEVIAHGRSGLICEDDEDLPRAAIQATSLDRRECRRFVEKRFNRSRMTAKYEMLYEKLASHDRHDLDGPVAAEHVHRNISLVSS
jgi:glycosyltransferase involved in cell wall biosynthesis